MDDLTGLETALKQRDRFKAERDQLREALRTLASDLLERVAPCAHCGGTGDEHYGKLPQAHACPVCGGTGEVLDATPLIQDIREALEDTNG